MQHVQLEIQADGGNIKWRQAQQGKFASAMPSMQKFYANMVNKIIYAIKFEIKHYWNNVLKVFKDIFRFKTWEYAALLFLAIKLFMKKYEYIKWIIVIIIVLHLLDRWFQAKPWENQYNRERKDAIEKMKTKIPR